MLSCVGVMFAPHHQLAHSLLHSGATMTTSASCRRAGERRRLATQTVRVDKFESPEAFREYFKASYGPTIAVYRSIAEDPERVAALDRDLDDLARRHDHGEGSTVLDWEYLLLTARRRT